MKTRKPLLRVYISSTPRDKDLARDVARRLTASGKFVAQDDPLRGVAESDLKKTILKLLRESDAVVMLVTPTSLKSPWPMTELGMADGLDKVVVPVTVGVTPEELPEPLQSYPPVTYDRLDEAIADLTRQLTRGRDAASA